MTNAVLIIIAQCLFYLFVEKFLKESFIIMFFYFLKIITFLLLINHVLGLVTQCVNQLLSIVHSIYLEFDHNPSLEVRGNFLDISKTFLFYHFWHDGLLYELEVLVFLEIY